MLYKYQKKIKFKYFKAGTTEAKDLKLTVETLKCKEEGKLEVETGLVKKVGNIIFFFRQPLKEEI